MKYAYLMFLSIIILAGGIVFCLNYLQDLNQGNKIIERPFYFNSSELAKQEQAYNLSVNNFSDDFSNAGKAHWTHMPITYQIMDEKKCGQYETFQIKYAMGQLEEFTNGAVAFRKFNSSLNQTIGADIIFYCSYISNCYNEEVNSFAGGFTVTETICAHDLGKTKITNMRESKILGAEIELVGLSGFAEDGVSGKPSGFSIGDCGYPLTELHEILHAFGYKHQEDNSSIMNPYNVENVGYDTYNPEQCKNSIHSVDSVILKDLISTYGKQN